MNRSQAEKRVRELRAQIRHHDYLYYVKDAPEIADSAYDTLFSELTQLEERFPALRTEDSPTQRVAGAALDKFPSVAHTAPMLSLDSSGEAASLARFDERVRKGIGDAVAYVVEPKLDGASVELVYQNGTLARASTRGDGLTGEGVTENVRTIRAVPLRLRDRDVAPPHLVAIRCEVIMRLGAFEQLNEQLLEAGKEPFANPRNAAAGALRQLDPQVTAQRPLDLYAYEVLTTSGEPVDTQWSVLELLRGWGLPVNELSRRIASVEEILAFHAELAAQRDDLDYEIDGAVVKVDSLAARDRLGATSHHPRWAFAFKFPPRKEVTRVLGIVPSVGRSGTVTPIALLRPVELGGVTVSRASLHNREEVARKDIREGDRVRVQRAGDVIPQVLERLEEPDRSRGAPFRMPSACPSCGTALVERGPYTVCPNGMACPAQLAGRIGLLASREAFDIEGLGGETARLLVSSGMVRDLPEVFDLQPEPLMALEGFAERSATKLVEALGVASRVELHRFLYGLGIPEVGATVAKDLARHFTSLDAIREAEPDVLQQVRGIGAKMAEQIAAFFRNPDNAGVVDRLLARVTVLGPVAAASAPLEGVRFVFTGGLETLTRGVAKRMVEDAGGRVTSSVSGETDYVVVGADPGSKADTARRLGVTILDEREFVALLRSRGVGG